MSNLDKHPKIKTSDRKTNRIELRVGSQDLEIIEANAKQVGLNRSQFLISRGKKQTYPIARHLPDPNYAPLMLNLRELKSQGNDLQQIGRAMNRALLNGKSVAVDSQQLQQLIADNQQAIQAILIALTQSHDDR
ncbi:plasmid mobilization protein [Chamaesiphon minutus]|uniref:Mobilization protein n=1 Tax=Chamaesiphon minutus (strain ATCC 27169 / PCC 6605) TaxID=1173020 RepID=K9UQX0_CHAP6|nr:hypothetical protein [Chamaesiphon minutus]AFY97083.1 hypothetical protein Cha6605_6257 [Chamaesiphon minutus PCC 6605]